MRPGYAKRGYAKRGYAKRGYAKRGGACASAIPIRKVDIRSYHQRMWPSGYRARLLAAGGSAGAPAGPAMTTVKAVAARTASTVRCITIGYIAVQVAIWHSFYAADPWRLAGPPQRRHGPA